jgi:hypothetical protein
MLLKTFMEIVNYRITEGSDYQWSCFGPNAYMLDSWDGRHQDGHSLCITFDTETQEVYSMEACDYMHNRAYRLINPAYRDAHDKEVKQRGLANEAWEDEEGNPVLWCDLEVEEDFEEKARAIVAGMEYDTMVSVPLDLPEDILLEAALNAHRQNITLNEYINNALREMVNEFERDPDAVKARMSKFERNK